MKIGRAGQNPGRRVKVVQAGSHGRSKLSVGCSQQDTQGSCTCRGCCSGMVSGRQSWGRISCKGGPQEAEFFPGLVGVAHKGLLGSVQALFYNMCSDCNDGMVCDERKW